MTSPLLYMHVAEALTERIEQGSLAPGDRLLSERGLAEEFGVNRRTVRQALDVLTRRGQVERRRGSGTFVSQPRLERGASEFFHFTERLRERGYETGAKIMALERVASSRKTAEDLDLVSGAEILRFHRLRTINTLPIVIETFSVPAVLVPRIEDHDLSMRSFYEVLRTEYGIEMERSRQSLEAVVLSELEAQWLQTEPGAPGMLERRLSFDRDGRPVESGTDLYRGDRVRFNTEAATISVAPSI